MKIAIPGVGFLLLYSAYYFISKTIIMPGWAFTLFFYFFIFFLGVGGVLSYRSGELFFCVLDRYLTFSGW